MQTVIFPLSRHFLLISALDLYNRKEIYAEVVRRNNNRCGVLVDGVYQFSSPPAWRSYNGRKWWHCAIDAC
ncbi:MAG: hypothetical protein NT075_34835 [Chloroflexi bacterium]|nr:hypothetical protein [Chloroflexota bacterium]